MQVNFQKKMKTLSHKLHNFHRHPIKIQDLYRITEFFDGSLLNMQNNIISFMFQPKWLDFIHNNSYIYS